MSGLYFASSSIEGFLDVLNALTRLQIEFATLDWAQNNQGYESRRATKKGTYEFVVHLTLQLEPRHHLKPL